MSEKTYLSPLAVGGDRFGRDFGIVTLRLAVYAGLTYAAYRFLKSEASTRVFEGSLARYFEEPRILCTTLAAGTVLVLETAIQRAGQREAFYRGRAVGEAQTQQANREEMEATAARLEACTAECRALQDQGERLKELEGTLGRVRSVLIRTLEQAECSETLTQHLVEAASEELAALRDAQKTTSTDLHRLCLGIYKEKTPPSQSYSDRIHWIEAGIKALWKKIGDAQAATKRVQAELDELKPPPDTVLDVVDQ